MKTYEIKKKRYYSGKIAYIIYMNGMVLEFFWVKKDTQKDDDKAREEAIKYVKYSQDDDAGLTTLETIKF